MLSLQKDHILLDPTGSDISNCISKGKSQVNYCTKPQKTNLYSSDMEWKNLNLHFQFPALRLPKSHTSDTINGQWQSTVYLWNKCSQSQGLCNICKCPLARLLLEGFPILYFIFFHLLVEKIKNNKK